jgi:hypothetical protein
MEVERVIRYQELRSKMDEHAPEWPDDWDKILI